MLWHSFCLRLKTCHTHNSVPDYAQIWFCKSVPTYSQMLTCRLKCAWLCLVLTQFLSCLFTSINLWLVNKSTSSLSYSTSTESFKLIHCFGCLCLVAKDNHEPRWHNPCCCNQLAIGAKLWVVLDCSNLSFHLFVAQAVCACVLRCLLRLLSALDCFCLS